LGFRDVQNIVLPQWNLVDTGGKTQVSVYVCGYGRSGKTVVWMAEDQHGLRDLKDEIYSMGLVILWYKQQKCYWREIS